VVANLINYRVFRAIEDFLGGLWPHQLAELDAAVHLGDLLRGQHLDEIAKQGRVGEIVFIQFVFSEIPVPLHMTLRVQVNPFAIEGLESPENGPFLL
jgi:hypothetical protein